MTSALKIAYLNRTLLHLVVISVKHLAVYDLYLRDIVHNIHQHAISEP